MASRIMKITSPKQVRATSIPSLQAGFARFHTFDFIVQATINFRMWPEWDAHVGINLSHIASKKSAKTRYAWHGDGDVRW